MSKISDLAKNFQQTSQAEAQNTNEIVKNVIQQHEKDLIEQYSNANKRISENIQAEQAKLHRALAVKMYSPPIIVMSVITAVMLCVNFWITWDGMNEKRKAEEWEASAKLYQENAKNLKLAKCEIKGVGTRLCVAIDPKYKDQNWGTNLKIVEE